MRRLAAVRKASVAVSPARSEHPTAWPLLLTPTALLFVPPRVPRWLAAVMGPLAAVRKAWMAVLPVMLDHPTTWPLAFTVPRPSEKLKDPPRVPRSRMVYAAADAGAAGASAVAINRKTAMSAGLQTRDIIDASLVPWSFCP